MTHQIYHTMYQDIFHDAISYSTRSHDILGMVGYGTWYKVPLRDVGDVKSWVTQVETGHAGNTVTASVEGNMEHGLLYVSNNIFIVVFSRAIISCCAVARAQHLGQNGLFVQHAVLGAQHFSLQAKELVARLFFAGVVFFSKHFFSKSPSAKKGPFSYKTPFVIRRRLLVFLGTFFYSP